MARSTPSLMALLGLVAVAGYQNRGRISEMLSDAHRNTTGPDSSRTAATGGFLSEIGQFFQSGTSGRTVSTALRDLVDHFKSGGQGAAADSWVSDGPNRPVNVGELEAALGDDTLTELGRKTGMSRGQLLLRLNAALPDVVNQLTPEGKVPTETEVQAIL